VRVHGGQRGGVQGVYPDSQGVQLAAGILRGVAKKREAEIHA
jgi:hypothetical protein